MNARNRVQLLIKFQYHWHNSFMCFLQYLLFTSISGCCNKSFTMNMCPPEQKSLQRVCLFVCLFVFLFFVCLFVCLFTLCSQVECRPPMLSFNVHLVQKKHEKDIWFTMLYITAADHNVKSCHGCSRK